MPRRRFDLERSESRHLAPGAQSSAASRGRMHEEEVKMSTWSPQFLSILRIVSALLFLEHGTSKLLGVPPSAMHWSFQVTSAMGWSGILEFVGGILLAIGLFTRVTAFILSGEMASPRHGHVRMTG